MINKSQQGNIAKTEKVKANLGYNKLADYVNYYTLSLIYPEKESFYAGMTDHMKIIGMPYHNVSDILYQYRFEDVDQINIVVLGKSDKTKFDFGIQLSLFSTYQTKLLNEYWKYGAIIFIVMFVVYCIVLVRTY